jgi:two-component system chemotaxis sensor kinase CheA
LRAENFTPPPFLIARIATHFSPGSLCRPEKHAATLSAHVSLAPLEVSSLQQFSPVALAVLSGPVIRERSLANMEKSSFSTVAEVINTFALELAFAEPGKDNGLLPINNFLLQIEEQLQSNPPPPEITRAVGLARACVDKVFDTTAKFDAAVIEWLAGWHAWMNSAIERWEKNQPLPEQPASWSTGATATAASSPPPLATKVTTPATVPVAATPLLVNLEADRELLFEFINESQEHLQNIEQGVLVLEDDPQDANTLNSIFRAFHTFKGGSGFLNLIPIKDLAHELESLLDAARQHKLVLNSSIIDVILEGGDTLKKFVTQITARLNSGDAADPILIPTGELIAKVKAILTDPTAPLVVASTKTETIAPTPTAKDHQAASVAIGSAKLAAPVAEAPKNNSGAVGNTAGYVKVDTVKLDSLIDLVGELVISESMVVQDPELLRSPSRNLARNLSQLRRITSELQRTAMSLRMVPIRATFQKMTRLVRDLAAKQNKLVQLVLSGEDTELDRNIVEEIADPLVHMIRNAADHGIEKPEARTAKGKTGLGTIHLRAFHRGGNIVIQIQDDGNGLAKEKLFAKAQEKGIVKPNQTLTDKEIYELIFAPGFSTADQITDISGRGVGMDVVRRNIEKLRGKVEIDTVAGQGTTFTIYLPLTLAIIDGMIVSVGEERYIIPTLSVRESFRPRPEMISTVHERGEMVNVRGRLCPLLRLYQYFDQPTKITNPADAIVVVVESGDQARCLMVDELIGKQEVVIKSLGGTLKKNPSLAGGAVLGDGRVGLILNVDSLVRLNVASLVNHERIPVSPAATTTNK